MHEIFNQNCQRFLFLILRTGAQQVLAAVRWPLDSPVLAQLYLALITYILMDQVCFISIIQR